MSRRRTVEGVVSSPAATQAGMPPPPIPLVEVAGLTAALAGLTAAIAAVDAAAEKLANKNAANGYAGLSAASKLAGVQQLYGAIANTAAEGNDARLSDARTPVAHTHPESDVVGLVTDLGDLLTDVGIVSMDLGLHLADVANPHAVTAAQIGAPTLAVFNAHEARHRAAGADALSVVTLAGFPGGSTNYLREDGTFAPPPGALGLPNAHASSHQNAGSDEINVAGLSGQLADPQPPIIGAGATQAVAGNDARLTDARTPALHAASHAAAASDALSILALAGFPGGTTNYLRADGSFAAPPGGGGGVAETSGTWTPVLGGTGGQSGQAYSLQQGFWLRIGSLMWVFFRVTLSTKGTITGNVEIQGFPVAFKGAGVYMATAPLIWSAMTTAMLNMIVVGNSGATTARVLGRAATTVDIVSAGVVGTAALSATTDLSASMVYSV
jgi:hypothetical protein